MGSKYSESNPAAVISYMMGEMSTFSGAEKEAKAKEAASDPERIERL